MICLKIGELCSLKSARHTGRRHPGKRSWMELQTGTEEKLVFPNKEIVRQGKDTFECLIKLHGRCVQWVMVKRHRRERI